MKSPAALLLLLIPLLDAGPAAAQARSLSGEIAVSSELTERGAFVGWRRPVAQGAVSMYDPTGWSLGAALGVPTNGVRNARVVLRGAYDQPLAGDWQGQASLQYYGYPGDRFGRVFDRWEAAAELRWRDRLVFGVTGFHYLHATPTTPALQWALDVGGRWPLGAQWSAQAALGVAQVRQRSAYAYGSVGLAWQSADWRAEVSLLGSTSQARRLMPNSTPGHLSVALTRMF